MHSQSAAEDVPNGRLPIGHLTEGIELRLLDEHYRPVGTGNIGEIVIRSRFLAAGYWRTGPRSPKTILGRAREARQFRTGDLARFNSAGLLEHAGRGNNLRVWRFCGNRVEMAEVEDAIYRLPGIERAVVECVQNESREPALVAFLVT